MYQTLFALAAVLAFAYYAVGRQQTDNDVERRAIAAELDLAAADVAEARMAEVYALAWDEEDVDRRDPKSLRGAPPASGIGPDNDPDDDPRETSPAFYDDIDDLDRSSSTETVAIGEGEVQFRVSTRVGFAPDDQPSDSTSAATRTKWVRVVVTEVGERGRRPARVELRNALTRVGHTARVPPRDSEPS